MRAAPLVGAWLTALMVVGGTTHLALPSAIADEGESSSSDGSSEGRPTTSTEHLESDDNSGPGSRSSGDGSEGPGDGEGASPDISAHQAVDIALDFLVASVFPGEERSAFRVEKVELKEGVWEVKLFSLRGEFKFEIDSRTGDILKFESEELDLAAEARDVDAAVADHGMQVQSETQRAGVENRLAIDFTTDDGIALGLQFRNQTASANQSVEATLDLAVRFLQLIEFRDIDGTLGLTPGDQVLQQVDLTQLPRSTPTVTPITAPNGATGFRFAAETLPRNDNFTFRIVARLFSNYALVDGTLLSPTETKIDIEIENFRFADETGTSYVAVQVRATSDVNIEKTSPLQETELRVRSQTAEGFFAWAPTVMVDGIVQTVRASVSTDREARLNLAYPRGDSIIHDPILGVRLARVTLPLFASFLAPEALLTAGAALTAVAAALVLVGRREFAR